jgi:VWFA-related protein
MTAVSRTFLSILCISISSNAIAQSVPPGSTSRQVMLDVTVTDKSGKPISGLQQQDFTLIDNKQPQTITSFKAVDAASASEPVQVILLVDEVNTSFNNVAYERDQIERFLKQNGGELMQPTSLAYLSDKGLDIEGNVTKDGNALMKDLNNNKNGLRTITRSQGFYGAGERVELSLRGLEQLTSYEGARPGRKLVVWISPGWPLLSGPRVELTTEDQRNYFSNIVGLSTRLREARITLYSIDPLGTTDSGGLRTSYYESFLKGVKKASNVQIGNLGLQVLAYQSGGRVLNSSNDVAGEIAKCVSDASAYYEITFDALRGDGPNEYHALELKVDKPGLTARTRTGYYAQP